MIPNRMSVTHNKAMKSYLADHKPHFGIARVFQFGTAVQMAIYGEMEGLKRLLDQGLFEAAEIVINVMRQCSRITFCYNLHVSGDAWVIITSRVPGHNECGLIKINFGESGRIQDYQIK